MMLFSHLIVMVMRGKNIPSYFSYELLPCVTCLFKDGIMRDPKKSKLHDYLTKNDLQAELPVGSITHIIDGGALLYSAKWIPDTTYRDIVKQYQNYQLSTFGLCTVILYGYINGPNTKDMKHVRGSKRSQTITVDLSKRLTVAQEKFFKNGIKIESLPLSEHAAYQHSCRVFLLVMDWKFLVEAHFNTVSWGWTLQNGLYHPIFSDQPPALDDLLKFVRCKYKLTSKNPCSTNYSCKKRVILYCGLW